MKQGSYITIEKLPIGNIRAVFLYLTKLSRLSLKTLCQNRGPNSSVVSAIGRSPQFMSKSGNTLSGSVITGGLGIPSTYGLSAILARKRLAVRFSATSVGIRAGDGQNPSVFEPISVVKEMIRSLDVVSPQHQSSAAPFVGYNSHPTCGV